MKKSFLLLLTILLTKLTYAGFGAGFSAGVAAGVIGGNGGGGFSGNLTVLIISAIIICLPFWIWALYDFHKDVKAGDLKYGVFGDKTINFNFTLRDWFKWWFSLDSNIKELHRVSNGILVILVGCFTFWGIYEFVSLFFG